MQSSNKVLIVVALAVVAAAFVLYDDEKITV